jgi:predicted ATPase
MGLLLRAWDGSCRGRGQVVLIQGEAGVGKSRLLESLREATGKGHIWVAIRCSPFHTASAFHPIVEHLKRVFGWQPEDTAPQHLAKLEAGLGGFKTLPLSESVRLFADLMSVPLPEDRYSRLSMTAQQQRDATLDAIVAWLIETAERAPVLMAWEDLHWADPTTLEALGMLIEQVPTAALLVVALSDLATIWSTTSPGNGRPPARWSIIVSTSGRSRRLRVIGVMCERCGQGGVNSGR